MHDVAHRGLTGISSEEATRFGIIGIDDAHGFNHLIEPVARF